MKRIIVIQLALLFAVFKSFGQDEIQQDTINGQVFYVYPFPIEMQPHMNYYVAMKRSKEERVSRKEYLEMISGEYPDMTRKELKRMKRDMRRELFSSKKYRKENKHLNGKFKKAVRKNPYPFLEQRYSLEHDIIPSLDNIPDGKYVQYFDMYMMMDKKGKTQLVENQVAGYFTIKNNMLEGNAIWLNAKGDTLKKGRFENGLKVGEWTLEIRKAGYSINPINAKLYIERGYPEMDTIRELITYSGGFKNGPYAKFENSVYPIEQGQFKDNIAVGEWLEREVGFTGKGKNKKRNRNNQIVTFRYTPSTAETVVHQPFIRKRLIKETDYKSPFDFISKYSPSIPFSRLYAINYPKDPDIELEEETINSYEGEIYEDEYYEEDMYYEDELYYEEDIDYEEDYYYGEGVGFNNTTYDPKSGKYISTVKLMDSLGLYFRYEGVYEKRYPNGQLMVHFEFKDGKLVEEDTIFWDNGKPYDIIAFEADSNQYVQRIYDYKGKLYNEIVYDSIGEFKRVNFQPSTMKHFMLDGYNVEDEKDARYFFYDKLDTLEYDLAAMDSLIIFRSWFKEDTSLLYSRCYFPKERVLKFNSYSILGTTSVNSELMFSDDFESWTGAKYYSFGDLTLKTTTSASYSEWEEKDSIPQRHVNEYGRNFMTTDEYVLLNENKPFTGDVAIVVNEEGVSLKSDGAIKLVLPRGYALNEKLHKDLEKYKATGKTKYPELFSVLDASDIDDDFSDGIFTALFGGFMGEFVQLPYADYYYEDEREINHYNEKRVPSFTKTIEGHMHDGIPVGNWTMKDQFGKLKVEVPFEKGLVNGTVKEYDYAFPRAKYNDYYDYEEPEYLQDSTPKKKTYYLYATTEYKNGLRNGKSEQYNWLGEIEKQEFFKDGYKDGPSFERNKLAYTSLNFKDGALDGYIKTYLTLNGKDSILLYDLNFQNGALQGESKAFHLNGKLAKKGFFLNGDPIDDYEAFDTLGFKYHYVKFLYSFPVEEKIWEENELSVRYLFDWRDSIFFQPSDITTSQSLERTLAQLGIGGDYYERPYYGRPSLVNKTGINYHITKYYPNDTIARDGAISIGKKVGCWKYWSYEGEMLYEVDYFDTIISINDSVQFKAKGILTDYNAKGDKISESYVIEKFEKYDCSHTDHYEIRQLMTIWQGKDSVDRMNGYVKNYYDNGVLQNEGLMKNGLPSGVWKYYDPYGKLNQVGSYVQGKRDGRWLGGDLSKTKYLGDICLNPNLPDLEEEIKYREKLLDIVITNYKMGKALNKEFYDVDLNTYDEELDEEIIESDIELR